MSYHGARLGNAPAFTSTTAFAQAVDPYAGRMSPPGAIYSPYGWGPDMNIGMPANYTHHLDYVREPVYDPTFDPRRRVAAGRPRALMADRVGIGNYHTPRFTPQQQQVRFTNRGDVRYVLGDSGDGLSGVLAVV
jgi:hypothetical protein